MDAFDSDVESRSEAAVARLSVEALNGSLGRLEPEEAGALIRDASASPSAALNAFGIAGGDSVPPPVMEAGLWEQYDDARAVMMMEDAYSRQQSDGRDRAAKRMSVMYSRLPRDMVDSLVGNPDESSILAAKEKYVFG